MIGNIITSLVLLGSAGYIFYESAGMPALGGYSFSSGPSFFPLCCAGFFAFAAVVLLIQEAWKAASGKYDTEEGSYLQLELKKAAILKEKIQGNWRGTLRMIVMPVLMILYGLALRPVGFEISTVLFLDVSMWICGEKKPLRFIITPIVAILIVYLVFVKFLRVTVPFAFL